MRHASRFILLGVTLLLCLTAPAEAQVELSVARGASADEVLLSWSGGLPRFALFRSNDAALVDQSPSLMLETDDGAWIDAAASGSILFYRVASQDNCAPGELLCQGFCIDPFNDGDHCGACTYACATTDASGAFCANGTCAASCFPGFGDCGQPAAPLPDDGCETDLDNDPSNCGSCGNSCSVGLVCSFGMCLAP